MIRFDLKVATLACFVFIAFARATTPLAAGQEVLPVAKSGTTVYTNIQYGFKLVLPESWKGFSVLIFQKDLGSACESPCKIKARLHYRMIVIRHPLWRRSNPRQDIPIMVLSRSQWSRIESGELSYGGAAPVGPEKLDQNVKYVFALPPRYTSGDPPGVDEVLQIINGNPLHSF